MEDFDKIGMDVYLRAITYGHAMSRVSFDVTVGEPKVEYFDTSDIYQRRCICCGALENDVQHD